MKTLQTKQTSIMFSLLPQSRCNQATITVVVGEKSLKTNLKNRVWLWLCFFVDCTVLSVDFCVCTVLSMDLCVCTVLLVVFVCVLRYICGFLCVCFVDLYISFLLVDLCVCFIRFKTIGL